MSLMPVAMTSIGMRYGERGWSTTVPSARTDRFIQRVSAATTTTSSVPCRASSFGVSPDGRPPVRHMR